MKNYAKVLVFAAVVALVAVSAQAADGTAHTFTVSTEMCDLIKKMQKVFGLLRILAFVGAGFYMAGWAWGYIKTGKAELDDVKGKGIGLLVGFTILFAIGIVISFLLNAADANGNGCKELTDW